MPFPVCPSFTEQDDLCVFTGGRDEDVQPVIVAGDGTVTAGTYPQTKELNVPVLAGTSAQTYDRSGVLQE